MDSESRGIVPPFYVRNGQEWADAQADVVISDGQLSVQSYPGGMILPARNRDKTMLSFGNGVLEGGVLDAQGRFVAGHARSGDAWDNLNCMQGYAVDPAAVRESDESVIFCGLMYKHFGHMLVDSTTRYWYLTPETTAGKKLAFVMVPAFGTSFPNAWKVILSHLGVSPDDVIFVEEPTRFAEVVVPDESFAVRVGGNPAGTEIFRKMRDSVPKGPYEKVYLSRGKFDRHDCVNESFVEDFYARRGFEVIYPETLAFEEQVSILAGAREIVSTVGTLSHSTAFFAPDDAKLTFFVRANDVHKQQLVLDGICGRRPDYVDAVRSVLPNRSSWPAYLFGPTRYFRSYLDETGVAYDPDELSADKLSDKDIVDFLRCYENVVAENGSDIERELSDFDSADLLAALHEGLLDEPAVSADYPGASMAEKKRKQELRAKGGRVRVLACFYCRGRFAMRLAGPEIAEDRPFRVVLVSNTTHECREIQQEIAFVDDDGLAVAAGAASGGSARVARVEVDLEAFFKELCATSSVCERWDFYLKTPDACLHLETPEGSRPFTQFTSFFMYADDKELVPQIYGPGCMSLWYLGERRNDFSFEFFASREGRSLVSSLLWRIVKAENYDAIPQLYEDFASGSIPCVPRDDWTVSYRGEIYAVGYLAYLEACQLELFRAKKKKKKLHRPKWLKKLKRKK